ncbi:metal ABC transporter ATP-binding protein [Natroniella sulfidigena]|uniref:metal ABC transporter ATP-binding protein n=1 Tax=Natroniella sulfidigena TaxID=723921 RepID=UPI00200A1675|nr:metal ABC transporter ATP-binding protein [Natroniella sulfidigena]MCK8817399.1 metal ABC transporter ATP-binding protein [Natroniella sulfidigena]
MEEKVIEVNNLSFKYDDKLILDDISLEVNKGDFIAFVGPNGSGKSTLLKLLVGSLDFKEGEIKLLGQPIGKFSNWTKVGYISQKARDFNGSFPATVKEVVGANLYSKMGIFKFLTNRLNKKVEQALELVNMLEFKNRTIGELSGGQQQRVFIARTLVNDPEIILLDEPLVGVDAQAQDDFYQLIGKLNQELRITIIMISHDINMISSQADKIACFSNRKIYLHQTEEFDYLAYLNQIKTDSSILVPEHSHQVVSN